MTIHTEPLTWIYKTMAQNTWTKQTILIIITIILLKNVTLQTEYMWVKKKRHISMAPYHNKRQECAASVYSLNSTFVPRPSGKLGMREKCPAVIIASSAAARLGAFTFSPQNTTAGSISNTGSSVCHQHLWDAFTNGLGLVCAASVCVCVCVL